MFGTVLLPTDFSPDSQRILGFVKDIPGVQKVILHHVVDATRPTRHGWEYGRHIENAKILLEENRQALAATGVKAEVSIEVIVDTITQGDVPRAILEKAASENVSMIAMGARGRNTIREILLGSVSATVIRHAKVPVLLIRFPECSCDADQRPGLFPRILMPVDFSGPSLQSLALVKNLSPAGKVILLHVVDKGETEAEIQAAVQEAKEKLAGMEKDLAGAGIAAETLVHVGYPPDEIHATAGRCDATLIVMSPQGEGWARELRALFIGSTTNEVIRKTDRPVLITAGSSDG